MIRLFFSKGVWQPWLRCDKKRLPILVAMSRVSVGFKNFGHLGETDSASLFPESYPYTLSQIKISCSAALPCLL